MDGPYRATKLWNEMLHTFKHGMPLKKHRRHMRIYDSCFTGAEAVNWLQIALKENPNIKPGISKHQVRQLLNKFLKAGVFCAVCGSGANHEFKESEVYRFTAHTLLFQATGEMGRTGFETAPKAPNPFNTLCGGNRVPMYNIANCENPEKITETLKNKSSSELASRPYSAKDSYSCSARLPIKPNTFEYAAIKNPISAQISNASCPVLQVQNRTNSSNSHKSLEAHVGVYPGTLTDRYDIKQTVGSQQIYQQHEANAFSRNSATSFAPPEKHGHLCANKPHRSPSYEFACHKVKNVPLAAPQSDQENVTLRNIVYCGMKSRRNASNVSSESCSLVAPLKPPRLHNYTNYGKQQNLLPKPSKSEHNVHDARGNYPTNTCRRNPALKIATDNSSQFPPRTSDLQFNRFIDDKCSAGKNGAEREVPCVSRGFGGHVSGSTDKVHSSLYTVFVLRLENILSGMEEIAALLPMSLRIDWLIRNVLEQSEKIKRSESVDSGLDRPEDLINNFHEELTGITEPLINLEFYSIILESFLFMEHINTASKQFVCKARETIPTTSSIENLVLGMVSPCVSNSKSRDINEKQRILPESYCFETAFASDTPVTRIIPQCAVDSVHLTRLGVSRSFRCPREKTSTSQGSVNDIGVMKRNASMSQMPSKLEGGRTVWRSKSSQDVKELEDEYVNMASLKCPPQHQLKEKGQSRRQRSWRLNKKRVAAESKDKNSGLLHCRNRSGGYVNPALSQSWEDLSQSLCSQEYDYSAALESLQYIMRNTQEPQNDNSESGGDGSSESSSYHTAASTPDRQKYCNASLNKESELRKWKQPALGLGISVYQLLLLLLPPSNRSSLRRLLRCLHNLPTAIDIEESLQVMQSMTPKILAYDDESDKTLAFRVVKFFVTFYKEILEVPSDLYGEVLKTLPHLQHSQKMSYCEQVTSKEFTEQGLTSSQKALSELLEQIVKDLRMGEKEKKRKLKMFRDRYPDIYRQHFPDMEEVGGIADKSRGILQLPSFGRRKNIRV